MIENMKDERHLLNLLMHVFWAEPSLELLDQLQMIQPIELDNALDVGLNLLLSDVRKNCDRLYDYKEELAEEYAGLFLGPGNPAAIPFSSVYLSETRALMSDVTIDVRKRYLDAGFVVKDLYRLPEDHIAVELEFLIHLTSACAEVFSEGDQEKAAQIYEQNELFLQDHFSKWVPEFSQKVIDAAKSDFYRGAATMLRELALK